VEQAHQQLLRAEQAHQQLLRVEQAHQQLLRAEQAHQQLLRAEQAHQQLDKAVVAAVDEHTNVVNTTDAKHGDKLYEKSFCFVSLLWIQNTN
jgi:hypothetical protein